MNRIVALVALCAASLNSMACDSDSVVIRYVQAIDDMRWDVMSEMLAEDAHYADPTMTYFDVEAIDITGRDGIVDFWRSASEDSGTTDISNKVTACFETGGYHLVNLDVVVTVAGAFWNVNQEHIAITGKQVMVIHVSEDGFVTSHHDYVGYAGVDEIVAALQKAHGKVDPAR